MSPENFSGLVFILLLFSFMFYTIVVGREVGDCRKELAALNDNMVALIDMIQKSIVERHGEDALEIRASAMARDRIERLRGGRDNKATKKTLVVNGEFADWQDDNFLRYN